MSAPFSVPAGYSTADSLRVGQVIDFGATYDQDRTNYENYWQQQLFTYALAWSYYKGKVFDQKAPDDPETYMYPLRINTVKLTVRMHSLFMWGTGARGNRIVDFHVHPERREFENGNPNTTEIQRCEDMEDFFLKMMRLNKGRVMFREQGRMFHLLGGVFFKFRFDDLSPQGFSFKAVPADYVYPVWNPLDYEHLIRVYVRFPMDARVAATLYGYKGGGDTRGQVIYTEQWEDDRYRIMCDDQPARDLRDPKKPLLQGELGLTDPETRQHVTPWVYIPRMRTGDFFGDSLVPDLTGLQDEENARLADMGDAVTDVAHPGWWGSDLNVPPDKKTGKVNLRPNAGEIFNAGRTDAATGKSPNIQSLGAANLNQGVTGFVDKIDSKTKEMASLAPVVYGQDEGSQRSGETLHARALPTVMTIEDYRDSWGEGFERMCYLGMLMSYHRKKNGVDQHWFGHEIEPELPPILPKDRLQLQQEYMARYQAGGLSLKRWLELSSDIPDVAAEIQQIMQEAQEAAAQERQNQIALQRAQTDMQIKAQNATMQAQADGETAKADQQRKQADEDHQTNLKRTQEAHDQQMRHSEDKHQQAMRFQKERQQAAKQRAAQK